MNTSKTFITVIAISLSTIFSTIAAEKNPTNENKTLRNEIVALLGKKIPLEISRSSVAEISFIINNHNEIVIISVNSSQEFFNSYVKRKMNYKKVSVKGIKKGEIYRMPVRIKKN